MDNGSEWPAESKFCEEARIAKKIRARKVFHCPSWDRLDFIVRELANQGYFPYNGHDKPPVEAGTGKMLFKKNELEWAVLILQDIFKKAILVAFF